MTNTDKGTTASDADIKELFKLGAHLGYSRAKRHPAVADFVFGFKNKTTVIDLEKTLSALTVAEGYVKDLGMQGKNILFVGTKAPASTEIKMQAEKIGMPYVVNRWIGGTFTNSKEIKKRVDRMIDLEDKKEKGELSVYTKKEQGLLVKEATDLERLFGGLVTMSKLPEAIFVVDSDYEKISVEEARSAGIKIVALSSSDCDIRNIDYPIVANDSAKGSISYFVKKIAEAYQAGLSAAPIVTEESKEETDSVSDKSKDKKEK